jgi:hypothetical protein
MSFLGLAITVLCAALILALPRRVAIVPLLCGIFLVPLEEVIAVGPFHFNSVRVLLLLSFIRVVIRGEWTFHKRSLLDKLVLAHVLVGAVAYICLRLTMAAVINRLGVSYELLLSYLVVRALVNNWETLETALATLVAVCAIVGLGMAIEHATYRNIFATIGEISGAPAIREGRPRCQGPFQHAIIAGVFGGTCLPLSLSLVWAKRRHRTLAAIGAMSAAVIVWASGSSTPAMCSFAAIAGLCTWYFRKCLPVIRWLALCGLVALHLMMEDPVWALVARGRVFGGSTGYYRYLLIDLFIKHVSDWWFLGTDAYVEWSQAFGTGMWDACNMYVRQGIDGGLLTLVLFCFVIAAAFRSVGRQARVYRKTGASPLLVWALGAAVFGHCFAFIGLNYFDGQISAAWYMLLAMVAGLGGMREDSRPSGATAKVGHILEDVGGASHGQVVTHSVWSLPPDE